MTDNEFKVGDMVMYRTFEELEKDLIDREYRNKDECKTLFTKGDTVEFVNASEGVIHIRKVVIDSMQGVIGMIRKITDCRNAFNSLVVYVEFNNNFGCLIPVPSWHLKRAVQHINVME
jgi:hypothetical protein